MTSDPVLDLQEISIDFADPAGCWHPVVHQVSLSLDRGERIALVGRSGSGKSLIALAALGLTPPGGRISSGQVRVAGIDLLTAQEEERRQVRGGLVGIVFQEPGAALNPVFTVGYQLTETIRCHRQLDRRAARAEAVRLLVEVQLGQPDAVLAAYPHQLSGGELQRALIAVALAGAPRALIADEPTTALDVTTQARVLDLLMRLSRERELALLLISHNLAVVGEMVDRIVVVHAGEVIEEAPTHTLFTGARHPHTRAMLEACAGARERSAASRPPASPRGEPQGLPGSGCLCASHCPEARDSCREQHPPLLTVTQGHRVRCPWMTPETQ